MAYPSKQLDATKNPRTRCSNCQTVFEVPQELLTSSDTRVRCGECLSIFDALSELHSAEDKLNASVAHVTEATVQSDSLDVTYSDFDLFSEGADLPEIAYFDQTRDTPDFDFDAVEMGNDETFNDTLFVHDVTIDADATTLRGKPAYHEEEEVGAEFAEMAYVDDDQPNEPVIFNYKEAEEPSPSSKPAWVDPAPLSIRFPRSKSSTSSIVSEITRAPGAPKSEPVYVDFVDDEDIAPDGFPADDFAKDDFPKDDFPKDDFVVDEYEDAVGFPKDAKHASEGSTDVDLGGGSLFGRGAPEDILLDADGEDKRIFDKGSIGGLFGRKKTEAPPKPKRVKLKGRNPWIFRGAMAGLFVVLVSSLLLFRSKPTMYNSPAMRPVLEAGCTVLRCAVPARIDLAALKMVKRNVFSHPNTPKALVINVSFRNEAEYEQQLPLLHMVLSNRVGRVVARQDFSPPTYLPNWYEGAVIKAGQQLDVTLEVIDPGRDAQSFEFYFRQYKK